MKAQLTPLGKSLFWRLGQCALAASIVGGLWIVVRAAQPIAMALWREKAPPSAPSATAPPAAQSITTNTDLPSNQTSNPSGRGSHFYVNPRYDGASAQAKSKADAERRERMRENQERMWEEQYRLWEKLGMPKSELRKRRQHK